MVVVGIPVLLQHSFFSSGQPTTAFSLAKILTQLGHKVVLLNLAGTTPWYEDVPELKGLYELKHLVEWNSESKLDLYIDIDGFLLPERRRSLAEKVVVFLRKPLTLSELEHTVYPVQTPVRSFAECDAVWMWDLFSQQDVQIAELLSQKPVYRVPFVWSEQAVAIHTAPMKPWSKEGESWDCRVMETNTTVASSCTLPIVILAYLKEHSKIPLQNYFIHNSAPIEKQQFFIDNVLNHCQRTGLQHHFVGRQRISDWRGHGNCFLLSHVRFLKLKPALLDAVWNGLPLVHNSPWLRDFGHGLERTYYEDNSVTGAQKAFETLVSDIELKQGAFAEGALEAIRADLRAMFEPVGPSLEAWTQALECKAVPKPGKTKKVLRVGFSDLWQDANPAYNFWTLLLEDASKHLKESFEVVPVAIGPSNVDQPIDVLFFGPFGDTWTNVPASVPKVHVTGENTASVQGPGVYLNLGFEHTNLSKGIYRFPLWCQYLDWFGADQDKLCNPRTAPLSGLVPRSREELLAKTKFCAFIVSNPSNPVRNTAFQTLNAYKPVDSAGRLFNTVGDVLFVQNAGGGGGELKKLQFLNSYKFSLTYENSASPGYVTEKFLAAKLAGCVPIYWGAPDVELDFGTEGYINANSFKTADELISAVRSLEENQEEWLKVASTPCVDIDRERARLAEVARLILGPLLGAEQVKSLPNRLGRTGVEASKTVVETLDAPLDAKWNQSTLLVTCATLQYLPSLAQWFAGVLPRLKADSKLKARVYLGGDVDTLQTNILRSQYPDIEFQHLPTTTVTAEGFPDLWEPQHFAWKLWIYQQLVRERALAGTLIWYMDCASVIVRWPEAWVQSALQHGICMLEDSEQCNTQWCHEEFCRALKVTEEESSAHQIVAGIMAFVGGASLPWKLFQEAWMWAQRRNVIVGPKWSGVRPDGKPYGHRHDQSILSILRLRYKIPVQPLATVYNHESLRRTFKSGASLYIHRGQFKEHTNFANRIGEAHIISLPRRKDRIETFKTNHGAWTKDVCLRPAVDGRTMKLTPTLARLFAPHDFFWKKAVLGCALSHLSLWLELAGEQPCCENYLILEDDVKFKEGWLERWAKASTELPDDYDVLYLGGVLPPNRKMFETVLEPVNESWSRVKPNQIFGQGQPTPYFHFCNYAYILSRKGAQKILQGIAEEGGYRTSADHMICNRVDTLQHYVLNPMVAGCYQDEDPKYATSQFNDFSRIDGFDSDLWNNDDRFTKEDVERCLKAWSGEGLNLMDAVRDGYAVAPTPQVSTSRFVTVKPHGFNPEAQLEAKWLKEMVGVDSVAQVSVDHEPLDSPIFIVARPQYDVYSAVFQRYEALQKSFYVVQLSDEFGSDPVDWISYTACKGVVRNYSRPDLVGNPKVLVLPLGPNRWVEGEPNQERTLIWSFFGTKWMDREAKLAPWKQLEPNASTFYDSWMDSKQLSAEAYSAMCSKSIFMPCPRGQNPECFRIYEALEHGAIPILVREPGDEAFLKALTTHIPILVYPSWDHAVSFVTTLLQNKSTLEQYRETLLSKWLAWKEELKVECKRVLAL